MAILRRFPPMCFASERSPTSPSRFLETQHHANFDNAKILSNYYIQHITGNFKLKCKTTQAIFRYKI